MRSSSNLVWVNKICHKVDEVIRTNSFGDEHVPIRIGKGTIVFNGKEIRLEEVTGIKTGLQLIQLYIFPIGRKYLIALKTPTDQLDIVFRSYFRIDNDYFDGLFDEILDEIWDPITDRLLEESIKLITDGGVVVVGNCRVDREGVAVITDAALSKKFDLIPWSDLDYDMKHDRLVISSKSDHQVWTNLYFLDTWNVDILTAILDWVFEENGLAELNKLRQ
ncbi:hypothetical protein [Pontibacter ruber]|uniref:Uncharacterized protein n=1 Tax=Pontibacter ruber TaxID=1343895 RepID=A0ABW5CY79_9BACT|nr:hypothetical protein [Pontibacter ruber]